MQNERSNNLYPEPPTAPGPSAEPMSAAPILSRDSRWLRLGGMTVLVPIPQFVILIVAGGLGAAFMRTDS